MHDSDLLHYFAYGSNLLPARLAARVPSARSLGSAVLEEHALRFHKLSRVDGSGKCDAHFTGNREDRVHGAVYVLARAERARLDAVEGPGYEIVERTVGMAGTRLPVFLYRARPAAIDARAVPFDWYHALVVAGARHHRLPGDYLRALERVATRPDADAARAAAERALLPDTPHRLPGTPGNGSRG